MSKIAKALALVEKKKDQSASNRKEAEEQLVSDESKSEAIEAVLSDSRDLIPTSEPFGRSIEELEARRIIHIGMNDFEVERAFRDLRSTVIQKSNGGNGVILITSLVSGGGASFVTINLAAAFALDKMRTAIVLDCDLDNPGFYDVLTNKEDALGLTDYLNTPAMMVDQIVHRTGIPRLRVIPAGRDRESKSEYFTLDRTKRLVRDIKRRYKDRYVFVDSPTITKSADTRALTEICDYVLLVVPYGKTSSDEIKRASALIDPAKFMGVVFNNAPRFRITSNRKVTKNEHKAYAAPVKGDSDD